MTSAHIGSHDKLSNKVHHLITCFRADLGLIKYMASYYEHER